MTLSSQLHRMGHARVDDRNWQKGLYKDLDAYCDSKLDDLLFTLELQRRLTAAGSRVRSIAAHPGIATTNLASHTNGLTALINKLTFLQNDPEHGALPTLHAATQDVPGGSYVGPCTESVADEAIRNALRRVHHARLRRGFQQRRPVQGEILEATPALLVTELHRRDIGQRQRIEGDEGDLAGAATGERPPAHRPEVGTAVRAEDDRFAVEDRAEGPS